MHEEVFIKGSRWKKKGREKKSGVREGTEAEQKLAETSLRTPRGEQEGEGGLRERERNKKEKTLEDK